VPLTKVNAAAGLTAVPVLHVVQTITLGLERCAEEPASVFHIIRLDKRCDKPVALLLAWGISDRESGTYPGT
jgi:hypothetical protein